MKKRKIEVIIEEYNILDENFIKISKEKSGDYYFEINGKPTYDLSEAISMIMMLKNKVTNIWDMDLPNIDVYQIHPEKCLYWLSGGDNEWISRDHYIKSWNDSCSIFLDKFGETVIGIIEKSKTFKDVMIEFKKHLNILILYDFAIENNMI